MKRLVIINGVMGVIGSQLFTFFAQSEDYIVYGITRKAKNFQEFFDEKGILPKANLCFSVSDYHSNDYQKNIKMLLESIPKIPVIFIHAMGEYLTEMDEAGNIIIENDFDSDGINDSVKKITCEVPSFLAQELKGRKEKTIFVQIGSLSDKYQLDVHKSWVTSINILKDNLKNISREKNNFHSLILNVSSVRTTKELIERPFVSIKTNADMKYWLPPTEIAKFIYGYAKKNVKKFDELELYKKWPRISKNHFDPIFYKERRAKELFGTFLKKNQV